MRKVAYKLPSRGKRPQFVLIECSEADEEGPRRAAVADLKAAALELEKQLEPVITVAESLLNALKAANPGKVEIEFGVELGASVGLPLVTSGTAKANFKVTLTWQGELGPRE